MAKEAALEADSPLSEEEKERALEVNRDFSRIKIRTEIKILERLYNFTHGVNNSRDDEMIRRFTQEGYREEYREVFNSLNPVDTIKEYKEDEETFIAKIEKELSEKHSLQAA